MEIDEYKQRSEREYPFDFKEEFVGLIIRLEPRRNWNRVLRFGTGGRFLSELVEDEAKRKHILTALGMKGISYFPDRTNFEGGYLFARRDLFGSAAEFAEVIYEETKRLNGRGILVEVISEPWI